MAVCVSLTLHLIIPSFNDPEEEGFQKKIVEKGGNAGNQHFPLNLLQCFPPF